MTVERKLELLTFPSVYLLVHQLFGPIRQLVGATNQIAAGDLDAARGVPGYGVFPTADSGHVVLGIISENHFWSAMCDVLGLDDDRDLSFVDRMERLTELQERVADAIF